MADELTPAELTLLGLLVEKPRHGYELDEVIDARGMREWTEIGFSSIYYLLTRLRDRGLIAEVDAPRAGRGKARRVYGPTSEGYGACARAAEAAVAELRPVFPPLLVVWPTSRSFLPNGYGTRSTGGPPPWRRRRPPSERPATRNLTCPVSSAPLSITRWGSSRPNSNGWPTTGRPKSTTNL